jgi:hypothetical protein
MPNSFESNKNNKKRMQGGLGGVGAALGDPSGLGVNTPSFRLDSQTRDYTPRPDPRSLEVSSQYAPVKTGGLGSSISQSLVGKNTDNLRGMTAAQASFAVGAKADLARANSAADWDRFLARNEVRKLSPGRAAKTALSLAESVTGGQQAVSNMGMDISKQLQERGIKAADLRQDAQIAGLKGVLSSEEQDLKAALQGQQLREDYVRLGSTLDSQEYVAEKQRDSEERISDQRILGDVATASINASAKADQSGKIQEFTKELMKPGLMLNKRQIMEAGVLFGLDRETAEKVAISFGANN